MLQFISGADEEALQEMSLTTQVYCDPSEDRAVQSDAEEADINVLARRFGLTSDVNYHPSDGDYDPSMASAFGDFSTAGSFHEALQAQLDAREAFMALPARVRRRFENDPGVLLDFLADPNNRSEAVELGLLTAPVESVIVDSTTVVPTGDRQEDRGIQSPTQ